MKDLFASFIFSCSVFSGAFVPPGRELFPFRGLSVHCAGGKFDDLICNHLKLQNRQQYFHPVVALLVLKFIVISIVLVTKIANLACQHPHASAHGFQLYVHILYSICLRL